MKTKHWSIATPAPRDVEAVRAGGGLGTLAATVLASRGITDPMAVRQHLSSARSGLLDPMDMPDMQRAVTLIHEAIARGEHITVYGDYDVDGVTATSVLTDYLRSVGANCDYYIPSRLREGYGLTEQAITRLHEQGVGVIITVDSGVTALPEIAHARALGMKIIVTDHHECMERLPQADAVVNCRRTDSSYGFRSLCGVGVAFKLVCALSGDTPTMLRRYAELVALGTVADVMPLLGENRILVSEGLRQMAHTERIGMEMLLREAGVLKKRLTSTTISFSIAPRINAAGRMGCAMLAVELFLCTDRTRAAQLAQQLCAQNRLRQEEENRICAQALEQLGQSYDPMRDKLIILAGKGWHQGVIGIVCSRLCERYGCPVVLIAVDEKGEGKGSARSVKGFHLFEALTKCDDLLVKYGGHELAAGLTVREENLPALFERLKHEAAVCMEHADLTPRLAVDCEISPDLLTLEQLDQLRVLEPFGMKNPEPVLCMRNLVVEEITPLSSDRHVRLLVRTGERYLTALLFGTGPDELGFVEGNMIDVVFHPEINEFRGNRTVQLTLCDVHLSECELQVDRAQLALYQAYMQEKGITREQAQRLLPIRADLVAVWRHISCRAQNGFLSAPDGALSRRITRESRRDLNIGKLLICLDVFSESGLISYHFKESMLNIHLKPYEGKADISRSVVLATLQSMAG